MEPTHAWHLHDPALRTPWLGCVLSLGTVKTSNATRSLA